MLVDMHVHCAELKDIDKYAGKMTLVCVADDPQSSRNVVELSIKYRHVEPCVGIHPWNADMYSAQEMKSLFEQYIKSGDVRCLGEVGLDKRIGQDTLNKQRELFGLIVSYAKEYDLVLNLHASNAWREVFDVVYSSGIDKVFFHWYTGPLDLLRSIQEVGYYIGVNPAWKIQPKHREIVDLAEIKNTITESDAPYNYREITLTPELIVETLNYLSYSRGIELSSLVDSIYKNFKSLFGDRRN
ncbi:MAG: TatD family hydrolase [Desulfurococcaceae archaeon]